MKVIGGDEVQLAVARPEVPFDHPKSARFEVRGGELLAERSDLTSWVLRLSHASQATSVRSTRVRRV
jgi:hypothetical protein